MGESSAPAYLVITLGERSQISKLETWVLMPALPLTNPSFVLTFLRTPLPHLLNGPDGFPIGWLALLSREARGGTLKLVRSLYHFGENHCVMFETRRCYLVWR